MQTGNPRASGRNTWEWSSSRIRAEDSTRKATTLKFLLEWAYGILPSQHSGGPSWIENDRYDIVAKAEGNATDEQMKLMVQTLLAERFN